MTGRVTGSSHHPPDDRPEAGGANRDQRNRTPLGRERGSVIRLFVILFPAVLAMAGLVIDGGAKLRAEVNATAIAEEAARAGAGMVNRSTAYATGTSAVSPGQAVAAARGYLAGAGVPGTVAVAGPHTIRVTVTITQPTVILYIIGIGSMTSTGEATANLVTGVTVPGQ